MNQTHTHSNVLIAVDAEIGVLERRLAKLHDIRRLAVELDKARLPAAAAPQLPAATPGPRPRKSKRQAPRLEITEILDVARDMLGDGSATIAAILKAAGRHRTPHAVHVTEAALEQLGAVTVGKVRGGAVAYALQADHGDEPEQAAISGNAAPADRVQDAIADLARTAVGWDDQEFQYQLRKRCGIEASLADVQRARRALNGSA
jgi:transposase